MSSVKVLVFILLLTVLNTVNSANLIYRKYEKKHPRKNYVQVIEIFGTRQAPPYYSKDEKELNDFLARDAYKTDMNCSVKANESETSTIRPPATRPTTTVFPTIPTTAYRRDIKTTTTPSSWFPTIPDLNNLFTVRSTRPTIKPNPRENTNPDYTNLVPEGKPDVQATKHPITTSPPTILIKETDDHPTTNRTTLADIEHDFSTDRSLSRADATASDDDIIYAESGESNLAEEDEYNEDNYDADVIPTEQIDSPQAPASPVNGSDGEEYEDEVEDEENDEAGGRRKRSKYNKKRRLAPL